MLHVDLPRTGAAVAYRDLGAGPAVLLLHATLHDSEDYTKVAADLLQDHRVVSIDWPGHGRSPAPEAPRRVGAAWFAEVLRELVEVLDLREAVVVGNSVGGYAACRLALDAPDRVAGLVLVQGSGFSPRTVAERAFCALMGRPWVVRRTFPHLVPRYMDPTTGPDRQRTRTVVERARTRPDSRVAAELWRSFNSPEHDLRVSAGRIAVPTLVVWGTRDRVLDRKHGEAAAAVIPGAIFSTLPTGHVPFLTDPRGWLAVVRPFLEDVVGTGTLGPSVPRQLTRWGPRDPSPHPTRP